MDISILLALQQFREGGGGIFLKFLEKMTFLGEMNTVLVIMAVVYWCIDKDMGAYLMMGWSGNRRVNGMLRVPACVYRPWIRDARVVPNAATMATATGYSFPSGHSMNAASVYGGCLVRSDFSRASRIIFALTVALVAFSRNYLGVHTPQDVLIGVSAGLLVMVLTYLLMRWIAIHPKEDKYVAVVGLILAVLVATYAAVKPYPADYDLEGKLIVDGAKMARDTFKGVGWCMAFLIGWILERRLVRFTTQISPYRRLTRFAVGLFTYYAVSLILVPLIASGISGAAGTLVSCFVQMFYVVFLFPLLVKLAEGDQPEAVFGKKQKRP